VSTESLRIHPHAGDNLFIAELQQSVVNCVTDRRKPHQDLGLEWNAVAASYRRRPAGRILGGAAYDEKRNVLVSMAATVEQEMSCETWEWDGEFWEQKRQLWLHAPHAGWF
jgi:hypothetical protein